VDTIDSQSLSVVSPVSSLLLDGVTPINQVVVDCLYTGPRGALIGVRLVFDT